MNVTVAGRKTFAAHEFEIESNVGDLAPGLEWADVPVGQ
jgi:hypothetical protein